jgi:hypothetical protein
VQEPRVVTSLSSGGGRQNAPNVSRTLGFSAVIFTNVTRSHDLVESIPPVDVALAWRRGAPLTPVGEQFVALTRAFRGNRAR